MARKRDLSTLLAGRGAQHRLSVATDIPASTISRYVHGLRVTDDHRLAIADSLGIDAESIR